MDKIHAKWGFGNAPLKPNHIETTEAAIRVVTVMLETFPETHIVEDLDAISHLKGQFTRTVKQDQWDWFTVWARLGRPSRQPSNFISKTLRRLRCALRDSERKAAEEAIRDLNRTDIRRYFDSYLAGGRERERQLGTRGFIYVLSTRAQPRLLKIGVTQRTVEARVKEINSATGVIVPFGVRAVWRVDEAQDVERELHTLFAAYRVRADREFFELEFEEARRLINDHLGARRMLRAHEREK